MRDIISKSLVELPVARIRELCEGSIARITAKRAQQDKETEDEWIQERNKISWYHQLFRSKPHLHTKEDFISYINNLGIDRLLWSYPSIYAYGSIDIANKLLRACNETSEKTILVSTEDLDYLR